MDTQDVIKALRSMSMSTVMMLLITYGMASKNPLIQPLWIFMGMLALQFGYQIFKSARSGKAMELNMRDATRTKKGVILFQASERDVNEAKENSKGSGEKSTGIKLGLMFLAPLAIFMGSGYVLGTLVPEIEPWQSYMIAFLLTMPVSTVLTVKMGANPGMTATPNAYIVGDKGIAFDHLGQPFIVRFPLTKLNIQKEKGFIEVESKAETSMIPNKLKLFTNKVDQLSKVLEKNVALTEAKGKN